jgi:putative restriction endonuclease
VYIVKQPSGNTDPTAEQRLRGRGNYEISGTFDSEPPLESADLANRQLYFKYGRYGFKATGVQLLLSHGKKRLKRIDRSDIHAARQVQAALLFPKSRRDENGLLGGRPTIRLDQYIMQHMHFRSVSLRENAAEIGLGNLDLYNGTQEDAVDFESRMKEIEYLHDKADRFPATIRSLLLEHQSILQSDGPLPKRLEDIVVELMGETERISSDFNVDYVSGVDVVQPLREIADLPEFAEPIAIASIPPEDTEIRLREVAKWRRYAAARGPGAAAFRRAVRDAYDSRCIFCGIRLPLSPHCRVPGVDSAHILPWATYDLDVVGNGLCLCKTHHWAFDQQLIAIVYAENAYRVLVTDRARLALDAAALASLEAFAGAIDAARLPQSSSNWPRPAFLNELYDVVWAD